MFETISKNFFGNMTNDPLKKHHVKEEFRTPIEKQSESTRLSDFRLKFFCVFEVVRKT